MAIDFPPNPVLDDTYEDPNGVTWIFNGHTWNKTFNKRVAPTLSMNNIENVDTVQEMRQNGAQYLIHDGSKWTDQRPEQFFPKETVFMAYVTTSFAPTDQTEIWVPWNATRIDTHDGFDVVDHEYTIPTSGYWHIQTRFRGRDVRDWGWTELYRNGVLDNKIRVFGATDSGPDGHFMYNGNTFDHYDQGDVIKIKIWWDGHGTYLYFFGGYSYNQFSGILIQED